MSRINVLALFLILGLVIGFLVYLGQNSPSTSDVSSLCTKLGANSNGVSSSNVEGNYTSLPTSSNVNILIVDADPGSQYEGMNGSAYHLLTNWPVIHAFKNQIVTIRIINCAPVEPHGFAISHYLNAGVAVRAGQSYSLTFAASTVGSFRVYCNIFCAIHPMMQNGILIVS